MRQKTIELIKDCWRKSQILSLFLYHTIFKVVGHNLNIKHAAIADPLITSNLSTLVWSGTGCYQIKIANGDVIPGIVKAIPFKIDETTKSLSVIFYGVGSRIKMTFPINSSKVSINLSTALRTSIPKPIKVDKVFSKNDVKLLPNSKVHIPGLTITFPQFVNK